MSTNHTTGVLPANKQVAAIDDEWRTLESVTEPETKTDTKTVAKPAPVKASPRPAPNPPAPRHVPHPRPLGAPLANARIPAGMATVPKAMPLSPRSPLPARAPLPPPPPGPSRKPAPPIPTPQSASPPPVPVVVQPVAESMICASVTVVVEVVPMEQAKPVVAILVVEAAQAAGEDEALVIVPRPRRKTGRNVVAEVFAAGGMDCEGVFDELPTAALQSHTALYALWSALGVMVVTGLGSAIWMALLHTPG